jgi:hypothetical protein
MSFVASSFVAGIFEDLLNRGELCHCGPVFTFYAFAAGLAQVLALRYRSLVSTAEESLSIIHSSLTELKKKWGSAEGALAALAEMKRLTLRSPSLGAVPDCDVGRLAPFVEDFGPELCRQYWLLEQDGTATDALPPLSSLHSRSVSINIVDDYQTPNPQDLGAVHSNQFFSDLDPFGTWIDDLELGLITR